MSATLISLAAGIGAPMIERILRDQIGGKGGALAADVIGKIAAAAGVPRAELPSYATDHPETVEEAIREVEAWAPELIALYAQGVQRQFDLLAAEKGEAWWAWAWRPATCWLIAVFWAYTIIAHPLLTTLAGVGLPPVPVDGLIWLTTGYLGLYMGGHTVKDLAAKRWGGA